MVAGLHGWQISLRNNRKTHTFSLLSPCFRLWFRRDLVADFISGLNVTMFALLLPFYVANFGWSDPFCHTPSSRVITL